VRVEAFVEALQMEWALLPLSSGLLEFPSPEMGRSSL
jgi:hypothetical protein